MPPIRDQLNFLRAFWQAPFKGLGVVSFGLLAACQSYQFHAIPKQLDQSWVECSTDDQEAEFRSWIRSNERWLNKNLVRPTEAPGKIAGLEKTAQEVAHRVDPDILPGCQAEFSIFRTRSSAISPQPSAPYHSIVLSIAEGQKEVQSCLRVYIGQRGEFYTKYEGLVVDSSLKTPRDTTETILCESKN